MGTAYRRDTRFELKSAKQEANGLLVECTEREVYGTSPPAILIADEDLTSQELATVIEALTILETKFAGHFATAEQSTSASRTHELMRQAQEAEAKAKQAEARAEAARVEALRIEMENITRRAEADELTASLASMRDDVEREKQKATKSD